MCVYKFKKTFYLNIYYISPISVLTSCAEFEYQPQNINNKQIHVNKYINNIII